MACKLRRKYPGTDYPVVNRGAHVRAESRVAVQGIVERLRLGAASWSMGRGVRRFLYGVFFLSDARYSTKSTNSCFVMACCNPDGMMDSFCFVRLAMPVFG